MVVQHRDISYLEHGGDHILGLHGLDLIPGGPDVPQEDLLPIVQDCQGLSLKINIHPTSNSIGDDKERAGKIVSLSVGMDPALKVPVS